MGLHTASALITFLLQTTAEWGVCWILVRLARSHRVRFRLWLVFFAASFLQWMWFLRILAVHPLVAAASKGSQPHGVATATHAVMLGAAWEPRAEKILTTFTLSYGLMLCALSARTFWGRLRLKKALRFRSAPSRRLSGIFREVSLVVPSRNAELWVLPGLSSPATFGWLRPKVIVPAECEGQSVSDLEAIFWHELSHVQRRDALWNTFLRACRNLLWFHPCIHLAFSEISMERELACDQEVLESIPVTRDSYAACLLRFARSQAADFSASPCIELTSAPAILRLRVESILTEVPRPSSASILRRSFAGVAMVSAISITVPSLSVLLVSSQPARTVASLTSLPIHERTVPATQRESGRRRSKVMVATMHSAQQLSHPSSPSILPASDPGLAAKHRVGMDVLTEYGNSQEASNREQRSRDDDSSRESQQGTKVQPAWGSIALGAVERLSSVGLDHDHDRR